MSSKRITELTDSLNALNKDDIYSMMLFVLFRLKENPDFLTLTELAYILDGENLTKFLTYFGGMTLTIPSARDFKLVMQALTLYVLVDINSYDFDDSVKSLSRTEFSADEIKETYAKIIDVMSNYNFKREVYNVEEDN